MKRGRPKIEKVEFSSRRLEEALAYRKKSLRKINKDSASEISERTVRRGFHKMEPEIQHGDSANRRGAQKARDSLQRFLQDAFSVAERASAVGRGLARHTRKSTERLHRLRGQPFQGRGKAHEIGRVRGLRAPQGGARRVP